MQTFNKVTKSFQYGAHQVTLESGYIARQASAAVMVRMGDTVALVTAVIGNKREGLDFVPLSVEYEEKTYAAGKIPGGFFKREGRPSEKAILTCRLTDRPLRPLFAKGFCHETQIITTVLSIDPEIDSDVVSMIGASAALHLSGAPFNGPIGAVRIGYVNEEYVLNPSASIRQNESLLDLVVAGTQSAVLMVESSAKFLSEEVMLGAVEFAHQQMQVAIDSIKELGQECGRRSFSDWQESEGNAELDAEISNHYHAEINAAYEIADKIQRQQRMRELREKIHHGFAESDDNSDADAITSAIKSLEKRVVRERILNGEPRIDGRSIDAVRPIDIELGYLPRTHGSAIFTRGETQAIVVTTLGTSRDSQVIDALEGDYRDSFMLHYNFPPFCVGETGRVGSPKRREIGHGALAKRALLPILPDQENNPYVIRIVSEITESNGSSSMATVCGASLSMMDAGINVKAPVAGVAMGLIKEGEQYKVLTDILGDEDHLGDMDFKVAGTANGITALQMDIKIEGITKEIMAVALAQAKQGREHILNEMAKALAAPRADISAFAPRIQTMQVSREKIRLVIGKGGETIRSISEQTGATIDIDDDGLVKIAALNSESGMEAKRRIELITADVEVNTVYEGKVVKLMDFGAFVNILPGKDGLVHISQISDERVEKVEDKLRVGDSVRVKVLEVDRQGRVKLSIKAV